MTETQAQPISYDEAWRLASAAEWRFEQYYKYSFYFTAETEGFTLTAIAGGQADSIYRFSVARLMDWEGIQGGGEVRLTIAGKDGRVMWDGMPL